YPRSGSAGGHRSRPNSKTAAHRIARLVRSGARAGRTRADRSSTAPKLPKDTRADRRRTTRWLPRGSPAGWLWLRHRARCCAFQMSRLNLSPVFRVRMHCSGGWAAASFQGCWNPLGACELVYPIGEYLGLGKILPRFLIGPQPLTEALLRSLFVES